MCHFAISLHFCKFPSLKEISTLVQSPLSQLKYFLKIFVGINESHLNLWLCKIFLKKTLVRTSQSDSSKSPKKFIKFENLQSHIKHFFSIRNDFNSTIFFKHVILSFIHMKNKFHFIVIKPLMEKCHKSFSTQI